MILVGYCDTNTLIQGVEGFTVGDWNNEVTTVPFTLVSVVVSMAEGKGNILVACYSYQQARIHPRAAVIGCGSRQC